MCQSGRSRQDLSHEYFNDLHAKIGVDTAENEPCEVWPAGLPRPPLVEYTAVITTLAVVYSNYV